MHKKLLSILVLSILVAFTLVGCVPSQPCRLTIFAITGGNVAIMKADTASWIESEVGMSLEPGDGIKCGDNSSAELTFVDGTTIELQAGTEIEVDSLGCTDTGSATIVLRQTIGSILFRVIKTVDPGSRYEVETPTGVVAARGSIMWVYVIEDGTTWATNLEGDIWAVAQGVELRIPQGQQCIIRPAQPPQLIMISAGGRHTVGLKADGTVVAVGNNTYGQCDVDTWTGIVQVSAGSSHTVGLRADGTVVAVGYNANGQCDVDTWTGIVQVSAGSSHTVGLKADGTVVAVGDNSVGQRNVGNWMGITQISAGDWHTVGLKSEGTVVAVERNDYGQCDVAAWTDNIQVDGGSWHTVAIRADGTVVAAGDDSAGQCNVGNWASIAQVSAGGYHTVGLKSDATVVAIGENFDRQCNVNTWVGIIQVCAGWWHTVGLRFDGTVVAVGNNDYGQCNVRGWDLS